MANFNIVEAEKLVDDLSDDQIEFLLAARQGAALHDADDKTFKFMSEHGYVQVVPFDHPRATNAILGVIPTDDGIKLLHVLDNRKFADADTLISSDVSQAKSGDEMVENAQSTEKDKATQSGKIKASSHQNKDYENKR